MIRIKTYLAIFISITGLVMANNTENKKAVFAAGCFWGVESTFQQMDGVKSTTVGYIGGKVKNPSYELVCTGLTGHAEAVEVVYNPNEVTFEKLLDTFFELHDPTTLNRQGPDIGTQYRSGIYFFDKAQEELALKTKEIYQAKLEANGFGEIVTEILPVSEEFYAEDYHQQYLAKNPNGYCGHGGCGVRFKD